MATLRFLVESPFDKIVCKDFFTSPRGSENSTILGADLITPSITTCSCSLVTLSTSSLIDSKFGRDSRFSLSN